MITFMLIVNFILIGIVILAVTNLYLRQNRLIETEKKLTSSFNEMENIISSYLFEMKEENETFLKRFKTLNDSLENEQIRFKTENNNQKINNLDEAKETSIENQQETSLSEQDVQPAPNSARYIALTTYKNVSNKNLNKAARSNENFQLTDSKNAPESFGETLKGYTDQSSPPEKIADLLSYDEMEQRATEEIPLYEQIILLQRQGLTTGEIAKKLAKGKTEIELILKLHQS